jgi:hypothetical protein
MAEHLDSEALLAYWLGELPAAEAEKLEEHFFACAACAGRLQWLAALAEGTRAALRAGAVGMVVTPSFVEAMKRAGMRLREYRLEPGGRVDCTIAAEDDAVVSRINAPLAGVKRLDVLRDVDGGQQPMESSDVPFDPASQELLFILRPAMLRKMAAHVVRVRLVSVEEGGRRTLGEYTFNHSPS